jgi:hypothetical protein
MVTGVVFTLFYWHLYQLVTQEHQARRVIFGGFLTVTGMIGIISIFAMNSPTGARLGGTVSLLVPQGWAVRGLLQAMNGLPVTDVLLTTLVMLAWSAVFFTIGVLRFRRRYA